jgi:large subunit ribosomal protein L16
MKIPKQTKYKKWQKGRIGIPIEQKKIKLHFGTHGLISSENGILKANQIETIKKTLSKILKKNGQYWIRIFPHTPICSRSKGSRMGKGKGSVSDWIYKVRVNQVLFEITSNSNDNIIKSLSYCSGKLPLSTHTIDK